MNYVFAVIGKLPVEGYSKTRLAREVGKEVAYDLYDAFIRDFFKNFAENRLADYLYFSATPSFEQTTTYFNRVFKSNGIENFHLTYQKELPFFERIMDFLLEIDSKERDTFIHLTGTDIPDFPFEVVGEVELSNKTVTIGPDLDGGFYYLGLHQNNYELLKIAQLLQDQNCTPFEALKIKAYQMGLDVKVLKEWSDIDTLADLKSCINRSPAEVIPQTSKYFQSLSL
ncbi:MAG: DUF2064 domain-containing protein [Halobacteriovoraceae bacterium]|jgi:uncharacterized protein|nr:DUF2064 domain-containing protein [Halobacteriovoraceae bacterium]